MWITCVRWRDALSQHAVCDDIEDTEREHHWYRNQTKLKHVAHHSLKHTKPHVFNILYTYYLGQSRNPAIWQIIVICDKFTCPSPTRLDNPIEKSNKEYSGNLDVRRPITAPWITWKKKLVWLSLPQQLDYLNPTIYLIYDKRNCAYTIFTIPK